MTYRRAVFSFPEKFIGAIDQPEVASIECTKWFSDWLQSCDSVSLVSGPIQEVFGVAFKLRVDGYRFWVGLSWIDENRWLVRLHHGDGTILQRVLPSGRHGYQRLVDCIDCSIRSNVQVSDLSWFASNEPIPSKHN